MPTMKQAVLRNGVPVDRLQETIDAVEAKPELGKSEFRIRNRWINGGHNRTRIQDFFTAGEEQYRHEPFVVDNDEPPVLMGTDTGANPAEHLLSAMAGCITTTFVYYAAMEGVELEEVESVLEGRLDLQGMLGTARVEPGYESVDITLKVKSDAPKKKLEELLELARNRSPVTSTVSSPVDVNVKLQTR